MLPPTLPTPAATPASPADAPNGPIGRPPRPAAGEPMMWLVVGIPALTVVAGIVTLWIAVQGADPQAPEPHVRQGLGVIQAIGRGTSSGSGDKR